MAERTVKDAAEVRLRVLELVHRHDFTPAQVVERAAELERYVREGKGED